MTHDPLCPRVDVNEAYCCAMCDPDSTPPWEAPPCACALIAKVEERATCPDPAICDRDGCVAAAAYTAGLDAAAEAVRGERSKWRPRDHDDAIGLALHAIDALRGDS